VTVLSSTRGGGAAGARVRQSRSQRLKSQPNGPRSIEL
jgi:hypothetical protein